MPNLYPGIPFSPPAMLTNNIGAADTIIKVSDVSVFPPAPNYATIGTDEHGETILYTAKTSDALSGCQRGVEGVAKAWSAGELIARNFTAADHDDLIQAIKDAQKTADGAKQGVDDIKAEKAQPDGLATLDASGKVPAAQIPDPDKIDAAKRVHKHTMADISDTPGAWTPTSHKSTHAAGGSDPLTPGDIRAAPADHTHTPYSIGAASNDDLLINSDFIHPINQRGQTEYTQPGYTIDGWKFIGSGGSVSVLDDCVNYKSGTGADYKRFFQVVGKDIKAGETYTLSALVDIKALGGTVQFRVGQTNGSAIPGASSTTITHAGKQLLTFTFTAPSSYTGVQAELLVYNTASNYIDVDMYAWAMEPGDHQTRFHQDADGNWVRNTPPPDRALELLKCQRYFRRIRSRFNGSVIFNGFVSNGGKDLCVHLCENTFRAIPSVQFSGGMIVRGVNGYSTDDTGNTVQKNLTVMTQSAYGDFITLLLRRQGGKVWSNIPNNTPVAVSFDTGTIIDVSAEL